MPGKNEYRSRCLLRLAMAVLAIFGDTPADVHAEPLRQGWRISNYVDLSSNTLYHVNRSSSGTLHTIAAAGGLDLVNDFSPWQSGIFADYHFSANPAVDGMVNLGAYAKYRFGRWDTTSFIAHRSSPATEDGWVYGTGLRYTATKRQDLGIYTTASAGQIDAAMVSLRYDISLTNRLSLQIDYGAGLDASGRRLAIARLSWELL
jgi:hypothetical protein